MPMLASAPALSDTPMHFKQLSLENGLSQNAVLAMLQDSQGFMWIGTENGLNRYDGNSVVRYFHDPQSEDSLDNDYVWDLAEDAHGNLWLATNSSAPQRWLRAENRFVSVPLDDIPDQSGSGISSIETAPNGGIWIGTTENGVYIADVSGGGDPVLRRLDSRAGVLQSAVKSIQFDAQGTAFISTEDGLLRYDSGSLRQLAPVRLSQSQQPNRIQAGQVKEVVVTDPVAGIWIASRSKGLFLYRQINPNTEPELVRDYTDQLKGSVAQTVFRDSAGRIWVGTQGGLLLFDRQTDRFTRYTHDPATPSSLGSNYVLSIYEDRAGLIWVGTRGAGTSRWNPRSWSLGEVTHPILDGAVINAFAPQPDGQTWIGTIGSGLVLHDENTGAFTRFSRSNGFADLGDQRIMSLLSAANGDLWIGTFAGGLYRYSFSDGQLQNFRRGESPDSIGANGIMSLHQSADGMIWAGTFGGGMAMVDPGSSTVTRYEYRPDDPAAVPSSRVTAFADADDSVAGLWVGTLHGGLAYLDRQSGRFTRINAAGTGLQDGTIYALFGKIDGVVWAGTAGGGLVKLRGQPSSLQTEAWSTPQGLSSNVIYGIQPDQAGQLWLSSNDGLMRFDPETSTVERFQRVQGLHGDEFNFNAHARRADGKLYFGGSGGFNAFAPEAVARNMTPPQIALTSFELFNQPARTDAPYPQLESLTLNHAADVITFEFAALDFSSPAANQYSYQLDGFDRMWSVPSTRQRATYTNLDSGNYTFRVRAANSDGVWTTADQELRVAVRVTPPPWGTWWAYLLYTLAVGGLTWAFIRSRIRRAEAAARMRQLTFYDRTTGLPNRELFEQRLTHAMTDSKPGDDRLTVLCLQAFGLRKAIDALGYQTANSAMTTLAARISQVLMSEQVGIGDAGLARIGDQTFVMLLQSDNATTNSMRIGDALIDIASHPINTPAQDVTLSPAVGIAARSRSITNAEQFINNAVLAATEAREQPNGIALYSDVMSAAAKDHIALERDLAEALEKNTLALYVQPKYDTDDKLVGGEALLRWHHSTRGWISPEEFVAVAEQSRLARTLNNWVVQQAVSIIADWKARNRVVVPLAINVSSQEYVSANIVDLLSEHTTAAGIEPHLIEVEITESVLLSDLEAVEACLATLHDRGHAISLDDFGTGYSSMQYLQRLSIDKIKIDRSFVDQVESQPDQAAICQAIIALAKALSMRTVAEGVENRQQLQALTQMGCDEFQGYHYSPAVPAAEFAKLLERKS